MLMSLLTEAAATPVKKELSAEEKARIKVQGLDTGANKCKPALIDAGLLVLMNITAHGVGADLRHNAKMVASVGLMEVVVDILTRCLTGHLDLDRFTARILTRACSCVANVAHPDAGEAESARNAGAIKRADADKHGLTGVHSAGAMVKLLDRTIGDSLALTSLAPKAPQLGEGGYREPRLEAVRCIANMCQRPTGAQQNWNILKRSKDKLTGIWGAVKAQATASNRLAVAEAGLDIAKSDHSRRGNIDLKSAAAMCRTAALESGVIQYLIKLLDEVTSDTAAYSAQILENLTHRDAGNQVIVKHGGGAFNMTKMMAIGTENGKLYASGSLADIAGFDRDHAGDISRNQGPNGETTPQLAVSLLQSRRDPSATLDTSNRERTIANVCRLILNMVKHHDYCIDEVVAAGGIRDLVAVVKGPMPDVNGGQEAAVASLFHIMRYAPNVTLIDEEHGAYEAFRRVADFASNSASCREEATKAVEKMDDCLRPKEDVYRPRFGSAVLQP